MRGLTSANKEAIGAAVENLFDNIALQFIGDIPKLKNAKRLIISSKPNLGLSHLFVKALKNREPSFFEKDFLKSLLESSHGYIESLKNKAKSNINEQLDGLFREASLQNRQVAEDEITAILEQEFKKSRSHLMAIVESESTKVRNLGSMMEIGRVASSIGDDDPTVFFIVVRDKVTCKECVRLHLMPDESTPRLWKFSELKQAYHKRGGESPSVFGLHPHCRCTLTYLSKGFGFDKQGKIKYHSESYDAFAKQRE